MSNESTFKQIIRYMNDFHRDVGQLIILVERLMAEKGYAPIPSAGNRAGWGLTSHYALPERWRLTNASRFYAPDGEEIFDQSLAYFINLATDTRFPFPTMLCAQIAHPLLAERDVFTRVWKIEQLFSFGEKQSKWRAEREERGWFIVEPIGETPIQYLRGYLLNVFDLVDRQHVIDNIILPLTTFEANLDDLLTVQKYGLIHAEDGA